MTGFSTMFWPVHLEFAETNSLLGWGVSLELVAFTLMFKSYLFIMWLKETLPNLKVRENGFKLRPL
jgi:hypothetical protein